MSDPAPHTPPEPVSLAQRRAHDRLMAWLFSPIDLDRERADRRRTAESA